MNTLALVNFEQAGTYHMVCEGVGTRLDVAREIVRLADPTGQVAVRGVSSSHFCTEYFAPRPRSEMLVNRRLGAVGLNLMRPWQHALHEYILQEYGGIDALPRRPLHGAPTQATNGEAASLVGPLAKRAVGTDWS